MRKRREGGTKGSHPKVQSLLLQHTPLIGSNESKYRAYESKVIMDRGGVKFIPKHTVRGQGNAMTYQLNSLDPGHINDRFEGNPD